MANMKPSLPRGTRDFGPEVTAKRSYIIDIIKKNFISYGFAQIETPAMENLSVLTGKYGAEGDQLLYKILNSGNYISKASADDIALGGNHLTSKISEKGLRYDLTVPFARYVVMNQNEITFPFKRFQIQPVWRADRPQKGRYREFYQCDADIIGSKGVWNEIELTFLFTDIFKDIRLEDYVIKVNHRSILFALAELIGLGDQAIPFTAEIDKLDKVGSDQVKESLLTMGAYVDKLEEVMAILKTTDRNALLSSLKALDLTEVLPFLEHYFGTLDDSGKDVKVELDLSLARGLSYYTGMIFEVKPTTVQMGSICGGGRYDDLTGIFGLKNVSGIGISFGLDRIFDVMEELQLFPPSLSSRLDVLVVHFSEDNLKHAYKIVNELRNAELRADLYPETAKIKKQFDYADKTNASYTLVIGDNEMESHQYMLKDMNSGNQEPLTIDEIIQRLKG